ncbi:high affinity immunoglobulin gamma Fc receptor I-like [Discoglossus pictus]
MTVLVLTILVLTLMGNTAAAKTELALNPPWTKLFPGESVTLSCNVPSTDQGKEQYVWYRDNERMAESKRDFIIQNATEKDGGNYQCKTTNGDLSNAVRLNVTSDFVILQVPYAITEGEDVSLRCHSWPTFKVRNTIFFKDGINIPYSSSNSFYNKTSVDMSFSGTYRCDKEFEFPSATVTLSNEASVSVQAPIRNNSRKPEISFDPPWNVIFTGESVMLICTAPATEQGEIKYFWFKDSKWINEENLKYLNIENAAINDSGLYYCLAGIAGFSNMFKLDVSKDDVILQVPYSIMEGEDLTLRCHSRHQYKVKNTAFYKDGEIIYSSNRKMVYDIRRVDYTFSGSYKCEQEIEYPPFTSKISDQEYVSVKGTKQEDNGYRNQNIIRLILSVCIVIAALCILIHHIKGEGMKPPGDISISNPPSLP